MTTISIASQTMNISGGISFPDNPAPHYASVTAMIASCIKSGSSLRCNIDGKPYMIGSDALRDSVISFEVQRKQATNTPQPTGYKGDGKLSPTAKTPRNSPITTQGAQ